MANRLAHEPVPAARRPSGVNRSLWDIATDPLWENYRELALKHDLRASWSTPIFDAQHRVLGTFAMYFRAPGRPDVRHLRLIGISTHVAAIAITRHQRVEALRASEERLRLALSGGNVDVWEYDMENSTLRWHGGLKTILGSPSSVENVDFQSLVGAIHPEDRQTVQAAFHSSLAQGSGHDVEFRVIDPEGSLHWFVSKGLCEYDSAGKAVRMRGVAFEVTKRKRARKRSRNEKRYWLRPSASRGLAAMSGTYAQILSADRKSFAGSLVCFLMSLNRHSKAILCEFIRTTGARRGG